MKHFFYQHRKEWELPPSSRFHEFIDYLLNNSKLKEYLFEFPTRNITRYTWGNISFYAIVSSLKQNSYFTHRTAMYLNKLIDDESTDIYLNIEQRLNTKQDRSLEQQRIDMAFSRSVRSTNNLAKYDGKSIYLLNGMYTGNLGVYSAKWHGGAIRTTNLERTLIDIAVRPNYSGGVTEVAKAYRNARETVSVKKLADTLVKLNFIYPYHQVVGFYLDKSVAYDRNEIEIFRKFGLKFDFYLAHKMSKTIFSPEWRIHYPEDFRM